MDIIKPAEMLNKSKSGNFVFAPNGNICHVQIFDKIEMEQCAEMIGNLAQIIGQLPQQEVLLQASASIKSPYEIPENRFVFDVFINSGGGEKDTCYSIGSMFSLAKAKGAIVRTNTIGRAESAASMLAIQGTPGYRMMTHNASIFIHYGRSTRTTTRLDEREELDRIDDIKQAQVAELYKTCTRLPEKDIKEYLNIEWKGKLFAQECLDKGLTDWILTRDGHFISKKYGRNR